MEKLIENNKFLDKYNTIIFDFDGVILDSNCTKKIAISEAVRGILSKQTANEFVEYFVGLNGVPREEKIAKYVPKAKYRFVLEKYEDTIRQKLKLVKLIPGVEDFIKKLSNLDNNMIVLSGGTQTEVFQLLKDRGLVDSFDGVYGGPKNKEENLKGVSIKRPVLYFGDSEIDYIVSKNNDFDFVFVYGASDILDWHEKIKDWQLVHCIKNFSNEG